ncbi:hypothetical protein COEREDRAFT_15906 [Coemansia reversa NRRL 1564]|uniref:Uncharacterized protein n=1 Tax=Coemansia reversa (strain ATCC 12441 / NRRL 1564) TaxID=763665 RepID=A0A2G5B9Y9_COERN|nr:hypothetical protein COEREDRAFT_15906 [Coemansia reversa NRRL 1564]|eukprot:PIA15836.1 hypothetical protein COEREDRAFT_15906 [Coemansia reversa NRRL 1564]
MKASGSEEDGTLERPRATLLTADGGVVATRVHYETLNDAMFLVRATVLAAVVCLAAVVLLSLATANVDLKLGFMAVTTYPRLLFSSAVWTSTSVFSAILVAWFVVYCVFCHVVRLHFNTTDPPRDWDDRNGEWSVVELDVRTHQKPPPTSSEGRGVAAQHSEDVQAAGTAADGLTTPSPSLSPPSTCGETETISCAGPSASDLWKLCVQPMSQTNGAAPKTEIALLTPDKDYQCWRASQRSRV